MKKFAVLLLTLLLLGCFVSAGAAEETTHTEATVFAKCDEIVQISAPSNPSTGNTWMISYVSPGLDVLIDPMTSIGTGFVDSNGLYQCWVSAKTPGFYQFKAEYASAWGEEPSMTLKAMFVYFPEFVNIQSGVVSIRAF